MGTSQGLAPQPATNPKKKLLCTAGQLNAALWVTPSCTCSLSKSSSWALYVLPDALLKKWLHSKHESPQASTKVRSEEYDPNSFPPYWHPVEEPQEFSLQFPTSFLFLFGSIVCCYAFSVTNLHLKTRRCEQYCTAVWFLLLVTLTVFSWR